VSDSEHYVEGLPGELDRFLADFFPRKRWQARVQYDHRAREFFLDITLRDGALAGDDRFLSLLAFYGRGQSRLLREKAGLELHCRLYAADGADLTPQLRTAESTYLDGTERGSLMGRQLAWLGFRHRLVRQFLPRSLLWAAAITLLVLGLNLSFTAAVVLCMVAITVQMVLISVTSRRRI
jgi:hypothetical protein